MPHRFTCQNLVISFEVDETGPRTQGFKFSFEKSRSHRRITNLQITVQRGPHTNTTFLKNFFPPGIFQRQFDLIAVVELHTHYVVTTRTEIHYPPPETPVQVQPASQSEHEQTRFEQALQSLAKENRVPDFTLGEILDILGCRE